MGTAEEQHRSTDGLLHYKHLLGALEEEEGGESRGSCPQASDGLPTHAYR
jgi:hypothetical protein